MDKDSELYRTYRRKRGDTVLRRIHRCLLVFEGDHIVVETADIVCHSETVQLWLDRFSEGGIAAPFNRARTGRPSKWTRRSSAR